MQTENLDMDLINHVFFKPLGLVPEGEVDKRVKERFGYLKKDNIQHQANVVNLKSKTELAKYGKEKSEQLVEALKHANTAEHGRMKEMHENHIDRLKKIHEDVLKQREQTHDHEIKQTLQQLKDVHERDLKKIEKELQHKHAADKDKEIKKMSEDHQLELDELKARLEKDMKRIMDDMNHAKFPMYEPIPKEIVNEFIRTNGQDHQLRNIIELNDAINDRHLGEFQDMQKEIDIYIDFKRIDSDVDLYEHNYQNFEKIRADALQVRELESQMARNVSHRYSQRRRPG